MAAPIPSDLISRCEYKSLKAEASTVVILYPTGGATRAVATSEGRRYDAAGNLNSRTNNAPFVQTFIVNSLNELTTLSRSGTLTVAGTTTTNATSVTINSLSANRYNDATFALGGFTLVDGSNSFTAVAQDAVGRQDTQSVTVNLPASPSYSYDLNGNLLNDGTRYFSYDDENQLVSVTISNAWRSEFVYDGKMRRRIRRELTWSSGTWLTNAVVLYVYDGNVPIQERDANNLPLVSYTRGNDLSGNMQGAGGIDGLLARTDHKLLTIGDSGANAFYHADGNGNVTALVNVNQVIVAKYLYDPFGIILSQSGPLADGNLYRFSSKEFHQNSGLIYYLYRFYDPNLQRWLNRDPIEDLGFIILTGHVPVRGAVDPNVYLFVANKPVNAIDALGLTLWYCTVPTSSFPTFGIGRHGYLWNDATGDECGQEWSCGSGRTSSNNGGPGPNDTNPERKGRVCTPVDGSQGHDAENDALMQWCHQHANDGAWFPGIHDCHNIVNKCLSHGNLGGVNPGRFHPQPIFSPIPGLSAAVP
jgi:RHS repeat-associated protein